MRWLALFLTLALVTPADRGYVTDRFDLLEVNHVHDEWCLAIFDQVIFWDWDSRTHAFRCQGWRLMEDCRDKSDKKGRARFRRRVDMIRRQQGFAVLANRKYRGEFTGGTLMPQRNHRTGLYETRFWDHDTPRRITAPLFRETWTQHDPERDDAKVFPDEWRRGLTKR